MMHFLYTQWFGYWWPSDKGNGPENIQAWAFAALVTAILVPFVRHFIKREFDALHAKLDHVIVKTGVEPFVENEAEKWEHWLVALFKRIFKRKAQS